MTTSVSLFFKKPSPDTLLFIHQSIKKLPFHRKHNNILKPMSSAVFNLAAPFPVSPLSSPRRRPAANNGLLCVKAMGGEGRESLDDLQRASKQQVAQPTRKRVDPSAPLGN